MALEVNVDSLRRSIEAGIERELSEEQWREVKLRFGSQVADGELALPEVISEIRQTMSVWGTAPPDPLDEPDGPKMLIEDDVIGMPPGTAVDGTWLAISKACALDAAQRDDVIEFRAEELDGQLMGFSDVHDWIESRNAAESPPTAYIEGLELDDDVTVKSTSNGKLYLEPSLVVGPESARTFDLRWRLLKYGVPDSDWSRVVATRRGGSLDTLKSISDELSSRYEWEEASATVFVLTGLTPVVIRTRFKHAASQRFPVLQRVELTVDLAMSPKEVGDYYRDIRKRVTKGGRHRPMEEKALQLAVLKARENRNITPEVMQKWNGMFSETMPDWRYDDADRFRYECFRSYDRLLDPSYLKRS
jgi:hypothetical protein